MNDPQAQSAQEQFAESMHRVEERLRPKIEEAKEQLTQLNNTVQTFIRENPGKCLLGGLAVGFLVGRWVSRR